MKAKRLTAQQASEMWASFYEAYGPEVMERAYGWTRPDARQIRRGERVWSFHDPAFARDGRDDLVGWGICMLNTNDPDDVEAVLVVGVWPDCQRRGFRRKILDWMSEWSKSRGADYARIIVYAENEENHRRHHDESSRFHDPWIWAGDVWYPEYYSIFVRNLKPEEVAA